MNEALRSDRVIRHPKRGKAHRGVETRGLYDGKLYVGTACGLPKGSAEQMTEIVPITQPDAHDLCRACFPQVTR